MKKRAKGLDNRGHIEGLYKQDLLPQLGITCFFQRISKLDFIQLRGIAHRIHEAFEQFTRNLYHVGLLE